MRTLDRYVIRSFLWSALVLFVAVMALRTVADLFLNIDEFVEQERTFGALVGHVVTYYGYQSMVYFSELGGVIIVVAAAFTVARMNHTNELTAMLASGVSLHRVILPMVVAAMLMALLIVLDRELLIPPNASKLVRGRDEFSEASRFPVNLLPDSHGTVWWSPCYESGRQTMKTPILTVRDEHRRRLASVVSGGEARPAKFRLYRERVEDKPRTLSGWELTRVALSRSTLAGGPWEHTPTVERIYTRLSPDVLLEAAKQRARRYGIAVPSDAQIPSVSGIPALRDEEYHMILTTRSPPEAEELVFDAYVPDRPRGGRLNQPVFIFQAAPDATGRAGRILGIFHARSATWARPDAGAAGCWQLEAGSFFHPSDLSEEDLVLRQSSKWLDLMSIGELTRLVDRVPDRNAALLAKHCRFADPINNLIMLLLGLPFILSRERNIKASATLCLLMVCTYFLFVYVCRLVGLNPLLAAFLPVLLFGAVAAMMLDAIKT
jgi:lipopolysaccharide export LptBFGC system permease protein LptF